MIEIWHNPKCSKSRETLALLQARGLEPAIVRYLDEPPTRARIVEVLGLLGLSPRELVRTKETLFEELGLTKTSSDRALLDAMASHPRLIERPIVITPKGARIGRPPERVIELL